VAITLTKGTLVRTYEDPGAQTVNAVIAYTFSNGIVDEFNHTGIKMSDLLAIAAAATPSRSYYTKADIAQAIMNALAPDLAPATIGVAGS